MFTKQVNLKPFDAKSPNGSPQKKQTKLRRLSKEADADAFEYVKNIIQQLLVNYSSFISIIFSG